MNTVPMIQTDEVRRALAEGKPVVALESTIITHGMPWPANAQMAQQVEQIIRDGGAVPATLAIIDGVIHVGLDGDQREKLARSPDAMKVSRADLAFAVAEGRTAGTTVAATMMIAHRAGIRVFATGGIGGVHRGAETSFDVSADLQELARTPVITVCAGAKAILDLPKTLEMLETLGVPVIGYGTDDFPAFWSRKSGLAAPLRLDEPSAIARFQAARQKLGDHGGMLVANPIPASHEIPMDEIEVFIAKALDKAGQDGITGKAVTPFLLAQMLDITAGRSLAATRALVENNARLAAAIAVAMAGASS